MSRLENPLKSSLRIVADVFKQALVLQLMLLTCGCPEDNPAARVDAGAGDGVAGNGAGSRAGGGAAKTEHCMDDDDCIKVETRTAVGGNACIALSKIDACTIPYYGYCTIQQLSYGPMTNSEGSEIVKLPLLVDRTTTTYYSSEDIKKPERLYTARDTCLDHNSDTPLSEIKYLGTSAKWTWGEGYQDSDYPAYVRADSTGLHERGEVKQDDHETGKPFSLSCYQYDNRGDDHCTSSYGLYPWEKDFQRESCNDARNARLDHSCPVNDDLYGWCTQTVQWRVYVVHYYMTESLTPQNLSTLSDIYRSACATTMGEWHDSDTFRHDM